MNPETLNQFILDGMLNISAGLDHAAGHLLRSGSMSVTKSCWSTALNHVIFDWENRTITVYNFDGDQRILYFNFTQSYVEEHIHPAPFEDYCEEFWIMYLEEAYVELIDFILSTCHEPYS